jgi:hypothetical protein
MTPRRFFAHALRVFKSPEHEFVLSAGLSVEWGGTGSSTVGAEASTPTRRRSDSVMPVAITGQIG